MKGTGNLGEMFPPPKKKNTKNSSHHEFWEFLGVESDSHGDGPVMGFLLWAPGLQVFTEVRVMQVLFQFLTIQWQGNIGVLTHSNLVCCA